MIHIGTCGFSYKDWRDFYPEKTAPREMLAYYAQHFPAVELDFTYYAMPDAGALAGMAAKTPPGFVFCVKAYKDMTHQPDLTPADLSDLCGRYRAAVAALADREKLGCVLMQFPWSFRYTETNQARILRLKDALPDLPLVVEFRNVEWVRREVLVFLHQNGLGFCGVDEPRLQGLLPPVAVATSGIGYVRFHGRNARAWWHHKESWERYAYDYRDEELREWLPRIKELDGKTRLLFVMFNNHHAGFAAKNAMRLRQLLADD